MISIFKTENGAMQRVESIVPGAWVELTDPTAQEINRVSRELKIERDFLTAALDEEETSRVEREDGQSLIIIDLPTLDERTHESKRVIYSTMPLGIIVTEQNIVTVSLRENQIIESLRGSGLNTAHKTTFVFTLLLRGAGQFNRYLRQIDRLINSVEQKLYKNQQNKELMQLLDIEKSLVYFSTSLKSNEVTLTKLTRGRVIKLYEEDEDLLEDVLIEVRQAIEMASIYSSILSSTMDAFSSVISNNLNVNMKKLTSLTILITIPNIVFSFYGMNIFDLPLNELWFTLTLSGGLLAAAIFILHKLKLL